MATLKVTEAINLIKANQKTSDIFIPSLGRTVKFKHLTAGQQEKFVQSLIDSPATQSKFNITLIDIIKDNIDDKSIVNSLTIIDKYAIGVALRICSVGNILKTEVDSEPGTIYNIDLNQCTEYVKTHVKHTPFDEIKIDEFSIGVTYPTISLEYANEKYFKRDDITLGDTADGIRSIISNAFIGDAIMFIDYISIDRTDGEPLKLDFKSISLQDKLDLVRKLPNTVIEKIIDPMSKTKNQIEGILKTVGVSTTDDKIKRSILITFDASFFISTN